MTTKNLQTGFAPFKKRIKKNKKSYKHWKQEELAVLQNESVMKLIFGKNKYVRNHILKIQLYGRSLSSVKAKIWRMQNNLKSNHD